MLTVSDVKGYVHKLSNRIENTENGVVICVLGLLLISLLILALIIRIKKPKKA